MSSAVKEYDAKLDSKKRITIRGARTEIYHVTERGDGTIELSPRELIHPDDISKRALEMVEEAIVNYKSGKASEPVDLDELQKLLNDDPNS